MILKRYKCTISVMENVFVRGRRLGVMGGTFDPIHFGHLIAAERAGEELLLDQVLFIPAGTPPHKLTIAQAPPMDRYRMIELAIASNDHYRLSDMEITRGGTSFTVDTLKVLLDMYKGAQLYFITGADAILEIASWKAPGEIFKMCKFIAVSRPGYSLDGVWKVAGAFIEDPEKSVIGLGIPGLDISSTEIRERVRRGKSVKYLLPDNVIDFITERGLYRPNRPEEPYSV